MRVAGTIAEIWRYPFKSMGGERRQSIRLTAGGVCGDRGWAVRDEKAGEIRGAKKLPELLRCSARYLEEPGERTVPNAEITLPDGARQCTDDPAIAARLSALLGKNVTVWPLQPRDAVEHYRRAAPDNPDLMAELREIFGRTEDEPMPDFSILPPEIMEYTSPLGTYFDAFPLHLLTTASLAALRGSNPGARFDVRRFRPNFVLDTPAEMIGLVETDWCGRELSIGSARIKIEIPCVRCVMTTLPQGDLPKDPSVLRTIVRDAAQNVGVYASVIRPGNVAVGDRVEILD
jgi:uncharacterized protein YcbX